MSQFHSLTVERIHHETRDAAVLSFAVPEALASTFKFRQGQYLTLRASVNGEELRRAYSICSAEGETLRVGIKRVDGGIFSNYVFNHVQVGSVIDVMPPQGKFGELKSALNTAAPHYLGLAAGSGITPILSIIKTQLKQQANSRFTLVYGNRATPSVMFKEELAALKDVYPTRLNLIHVMSREPQDMTLFQGRIDRSKCDALMERWLHVPGFSAAFICGPESMMLDAKAALIAKGMEASRIQIELFASGQSRAPRAAQQAGQAEPSASASVCEVSLIMDGSTRRFSCVQNTQTILEAGLAAGIDMRYSCKGGVCSTCRAKVTEGEVEMDVNYALEDYEVRRGFVLTCQSYPLTPTLTVNFDEET